MKIIIVIFISLCFPMIVFGEIIWETDFENITNWESSEKLTGEDNATVSWELSVPEPFSDYRSARGQLSSLGKKTFNINTDSAHSGTRALNMYYETVWNQVGGGLGIYLGETGYEDLYFSFWMKFNDGYRFATIGGLGGTILKMFRIMSNIDDPALKPNAAEPMNMYQTPWNREPEWNENTNPLNASGEGGKQSYIILRWAQITGEMSITEIAYNPEGRAGSLNDLYLPLDNNKRLYMKDYHLKYISSGGLQTSNFFPGDWVGNNQWVHYEIHVKQNDIGLNNALFELFINGSKVATVSNFRLRNTLKTKFNYIIIPDNHHNPIYVVDGVDQSPTPGTANPDSEQHFAIDDIVVSTEYIGPDYIIGQNINTRADTNQDNQITSTDAMLTLRKSLNLDMSQTNWQDSPTTGDVNCDNTTNSTDAMLILRKSLGLNMETTDWCVN